MAELVGFNPMPWQVEVIEAACGVREDGKWSAREVGINCPRQNGKGGILELIELTSLFTWGTRVVIHSAHEAKTSSTHFERVWGLVEGAPELLKQVRKQRPNLSHGQEGIDLSDGRKIMFRPRTKVGGRGLSCDHLFLDEAMILPEEVMGALVPTLRARPNPQIWFTGSAVDQEVHNHGLVFTRVRDRAINNVDALRLVYLEWSLDYDNPELVPEEVFHDVAEWRKVTPAFGYLIDERDIEAEISGSLTRRQIAVELFGVGDYPDPAGTGDSPVTPEAWGECEFSDSKVQDPVDLGIDVSPGRRTSLGVAGRNQDGKWHIEVIEKLPGTDWVIDRVEELWNTHNPNSVVMDGNGPAMSLRSALEQRGITVRTLSAAEHAEACARLVDAVAERNLCHRGSLDLWNAIRGASTRPLGDRWAWSRKSSTVDISPLVACTLALWAAMEQPASDDDNWRIY